MELTVEDFRVMYPSTEIISVRGGRFPNGTGWHEVLCKNKKGRLISIDVYEDELRDRIHLVEAARIARQERAYRTMEEIHEARIQDDGEG